MVQDVTLFVKLGSFTYLFIRIKLATAGGRLEKIQGVTVSFFISWAKNLKMLIWVFRNPSLIRTTHFFCNVHINHPHTYRALIHLDFLFSKVGHLLEGVDGDEHRPDVCLARADVKGESWQRAVEFWWAGWSPSIELLQITENRATVLQHCGFIPDANAAQAQ